MEYETVCRYHFNALIIVLNNSGIVSGLQDWKPEYDRDTEGALTIPPTSLKPSNHYEKLTGVFGGRSWYAETADELERQLPEAMACKGPGIFHVRISPSSDRKKQEFAFDPTAAPTAKL